MLWVDMGLGKTAITLTSITHLIGSGFVNAVLVVAPLRVVSLVWRQEAKKWTHTKDLTFSVITGTVDQRSRALLRKADVYLINYENLGWLAKVLQVYFLKPCKPLPFEGIVWDEVTKCKNSTTNRVKAIRKVLPHMKWLTGLTGSPAPNGLKDLHGQYLVVDKGVRLGEYKTHFKERFFKKAGPYDEVPHADSESVIKQLVSDITLEMSAEEYNPLPAIIVNDVRLDLPSQLRDRYEEMERDFFLQLDSGNEVELFNQASLMNKALQFANGSVYLCPGVPLYEELHDLKLEALDDVIDSAQGNPVLCSYSFKADAERIMKRFKSIDPINLTACKNDRELENAMTRWKKGDCGLMVGHPASMGFGIDGLQDSGHILTWFGVTWSLDLYDQFNARLRRQGQGRPVICNRIIMNNTLDDAQVEALSLKASNEQSLRKALNKYRQTKGY
jgi:SNF2 family DNA or RNA helicase